MKVSNKSKLQNDYDYIYKKSNKQQSQVEAMPYSG